MANGTANYGLCVVAATSSLGTLSASTPFASSCAANSETNSVGGLTTSAQTILNTANAPNSGGRAQIAVSAAVASTTPAHNDYTDVLTFIATGTY